MYIHPYRLKPKHDLAGKRFGLLVAKRSVFIKTKTRGRWCWVCLCDCGKTTRPITHPELDQGYVKSCGCLLQRRGPTSPRWGGHGKISGHHWNQINRNAEVRGFKIRVTLHYVARLFEQQKGKCALSGLAIEFNYGRYPKRGTTTASLDRIDSRKGYIRGNLQWVHKDINKMKMAFSEDYFINLCRAVTKTKKGSHV